MGIRQQKEYVELIRAFNHKGDNTVKRPLFEALETKGHRAGDVFDALCEDGVLNYPRKEETQKEKE